MKPFYVLLLPLLLLTQYLSAQLVITSFSPASAPVGAVVTITGSGFSTNPLDNVVLFGTVRATVTNASVSELVVTVPPGATYQPISVATNGNTAFSQQSFDLKFDGAGADFYTYSFKFGYSTFINQQGFSEAAAGDLDGDGISDLVLSGHSGSLFVLRTGPTSENISIQEKSVIQLFQIQTYTIGDVDGDGKLDIVVGFMNDYSLAVLRNTSSPGTISFAPSVYFATNGTPYGIKIADMDNDGRADVVTANLESSNVTIFKNTGSPGSIVFAPYVAFPVASDPLDICIGDFNGDKKNDVATVHYAPYLTILKNTSMSGTISMEQLPVITTTDWPHSIRSGDLDNDGKIDMVIGHHVEVGSINADNLSIYRNIGNGTDISFSAALYPMTGHCSSVSINDMDGDGKPDIVGTNWKSGGVSVIKNISNPGQLSFTTGFKYYPVYSQTQGNCIGDFDGDGIPDIAFLQNNPYLIVFRNLGHELQVLDFTPKSGYTDSVITITGNNLTGASAVQLGGTPAKSYTVINNTTIKAVVGDGATGDISVTTPKGTKNLPGFTFIPMPTILSFTPTAATLGDTVTITGKNFTATDLVTFGDTSASSFEVVSPTLIRAVVATGATGDLSVRTDKGTSILGGFVYNPPPSPMIANFSPSTATQGVQVLITGANFTGTTAVTFGGVPAVSFTVVNKNTIQAIVGNGASGDIEVVTPGGNVTQAGFTFIPPPVITSFSPLSGPIGTVVNIAGANFSTVAGNNIVYFGGVRALVTSATATALSVIVPQNATYKPITVATNTYLAQSSQPFVVTYPSIGSSFVPGSLAPAQDHVSGSYAGWVEAADMDGDGKNDLLVAADDSFYIARNTGAGNAISFGGKQTWYPGNTVFHVTSGDLNCDGKPDLIVSLDNAQGIVVYKNISSPGHFQFEPGVVVPNAPYARSTVVGDIDKDGKPELIADLNGTVHVYRNTSSKEVFRFASPVGFYAGPNTTKISLCDLDNDGKLDMIVGSQESNTSFKGKISVFKNSNTTGPFSSATFAPKIDYTTGDMPLGLATADLNGDGKPEVVVSSYYSTVSVFKNSSVTGTISLDKRADFATGFVAEEVAIADLDGDAKPDIAVANYNDENISLLKNNSTAASLAFNPAVKYAMSGQPTGIYIADLNSDSRPEVIAANYSNDAVTIFKNIIGDPGVLPSGANPITGNVTNKVMTEETVQTYNSSPYVQRHYDILPDNNPETATATITLYFAQQDFDNFNAHPDHGRDLPKNPGDANKANLRVFQYHGTSSTYLPGTYSGGSVIIDPDDNQIVWNTTAKWWEVTFDVNGFSGFFIGTYGSRLIVAPPLVPVISNIQTTYCSNAGVQQGKIVNLPMPADGITVSLKLGDDVLTILSDSTFRFDPAALQPGPHTISLQYSNAAGNENTVANFEVISAVDPDVNVAASQTTITTITTPVIITASNVGGGTNPLYTFAKDRNFTNLLQAESNNNTLSVDPATLSIGDNRIYVRMKVNGTCLTATANMDSITLLRVVASVDPVITGLAGTYCNNQGVQQGRVANMPAAGSGVTVSAKLDAAVLVVKADGSFSFKVDTLPAGTHTVQVTFTNIAGLRSTNHLFAVTTAVTPQVDLIASTTYITSLTTPVLLAANPTGGGTDPLYTFARDKAFTDILQDEGKAAVFTLNPATLVIGDNKIYVRLKTSTTCYTVQTSIDSVLLRRDAATGIIDTDNPGQTITVFPNPFSPRITVKGLSSGKVYRIAVYNLHGQAVYTTEVKNKQLYEIPAAGIRPGVYWLSIYDARRKLLGTEKIIKY